MGYGFYSYFFAKKTIHFSLETIAKNKRIKFFIILFHKVSSMV